LHSLCNTMFSVLDNFLIFISQKVSHFGKLLASAKIQNITKLQAHFGEKYFQKMLIYGISSTVV